MPDSINITSDVIKVLLSGATIVSIFGYMLHSLYTGYREFKKDIYAKLEKKVDMNLCKEIRHYEEGGEER